MDLFFRSLILQSFLQILKHLLTNVTNKTNLNEYLAKKFITLHDTACKSCLYPIHVSLEAVSSETRYT